VTKTLLLGISLKIMTAGIAGIRNQIIKTRILNVSGSI
jgi:hypothetical protein